MVVQCALLLLGRRLRESSVLHPRVELREPWVFAAQHSVAWSDASFDGEVVVVPSVYLFFVLIVEGKRVEFRLRVVFVLRLCLGELALCSSK